MNIFKSFNYSNDNKSNDKKEFKIENNNFPSLTSTKKQIINDNSGKSFINTLKKEIKIINIEPREEEKTPIGWVSFKYEKSNLPLFGQNVKAINKVIITNNEKIENESNEAIEIINDLCTLYEDRRNVYIKLWGEDEYNEMFICPNYDDEYFDKLDKAYEIEEQKLINQYSNNDSDSYYDNNYDYDYKS